MTRFSDAARDIVQRHPAPAVSVGELKELLREELPEAGVEYLDEAVIRRLATETRQLRVVSAPPRRWLRPLGPVGWVVAVPEPSLNGPRPRSIEERVRATLRRIGRAMDPQSALAWARWNSFLEEERQLRQYLARRRRSRARRNRPDSGPTYPGRGPTTSPPRGPRNGA